MEKKSHKGGSVVLSKNLKQPSTETILVAKRLTTKSNRTKKKVSADRTNDGKTRATFIVDEVLLNRLKAIAYWERKQIQTVLREALDTFIKEKGDDYVEHALTEQRNNRQRKA